MVEYGEEPEFKISDYNSAFFINQRLHNLWLDANNHKRSGAYEAWNADLDAVWCELAGDVPIIDEKNLKKAKEKGKEIEDIEGDYKKIKLKLKECTPIINWNQRTTFDKTPKKQIEMKTKQYQLLTEKEIFLRRLQNKQGKGTKYRDSLDDYMDN